MGKFTTDLQKDIAAVLNKHCAENGSDTPDFILAQYVGRCLEAFDIATLSRTAWYEPQEKQI